MRLLLALALLLFPVALGARSPREMVEIRAGDPISIRPDRAYILFRTVRPEGVHSFEPIFMRIPRAEEVERYAAARRAAYLQAEPGLIERRERQLRRNRDVVASGREARESVDPPPSLETFDFAYADIGNVQNIDAARALVRARPAIAYLVEVVPGDYVLYGVGWEAGPPQLNVCMCLGTIGFSAQAAAVTDLGYFFADTVHEVSRIPELRAESGYGPSVYGYFQLIGATVRPPRPETTIPDVLRGAGVRAVQYHAVGKYLDPGAMAINRLAPIPGVLAYDGGRVIDVARGTTAPDRY